MGKASACLLPAALLVLLLLRAEFRRDRRRKARERAEWRAALDVEAVVSRQAEGETRPQGRALPLGLESVVARLERVAEAVQVVRVRVVVDELRLPRERRARRRVQGARLQRATALRRVNHA